MSADTIVRNVMANVPKAVAAGVVDLATGLMLGLKTVESHPQKVMDLLAPATRELFEGKLVIDIENLFKQARGVTTDERYFQEILISSTHLWHYFGRLKSNLGVALCVVAPSDVNMGIFLVRCREILATETV